MSALTTTTVDGTAYCSTTDISDHLGFIVPRAVIEGLGFPRDHSKKAGSYWLPEKVPQIRDALVLRLQRLPCK